MANFMFIFCLFLAPPLLVCAESSSWKESGVGLLLQNKRAHQIQDHDANADIETRLDDIADTLKTMQESCPNLLSSPSSVTVHDKVNRLEDKVANLANDMAEMKGKLVEVKEDLNENRQYTTSKYHEVRVDVTDNFEVGNSQQRELRQIYDELKQRVDAFALNGGATFTRWGKTVCPDAGSELVYSGYAGGSQHNHMGGAASMLCLPRTPEWGAYSDKKDPSVGYMYGAEYQDEQDRTTLFGRSHYNHDVPCAVCNLNRRSSVIMIPAKKSCFPGWTVEYTGYLMTGRHNYDAHKSATDYYCIDGKPEDIDGGKANHDGYLLYFVESVCGSLLCPPYENGRELTCVVCSK